MKKTILALCLAICSICSFGAQPRVAVLDFMDETAVQPDEKLVGKIKTSDLAKKGVYLLTSRLLGHGNFTLIDRRDFTSQLEKLGLDKEGTDVKRVSFIHAAQLLKADAVVKGSLLSFSAGEEKMSQGGYSADFTTLSLRIVLQAFDSIDGSVIAVADGVARRELRQTEAHTTKLGEDELLVMFEQAINDAVPKMAQGIDERIKVLKDRARVTLTVLSTDDPALVEIDGVLAGSTPMEGLEIYKGDHVLAVSRPGYEPISKRLVLEKDVKVTVPMLRMDLTAEERKEIFGKADMRVFLSNGKPDLMIQTIE